MYSESDILLERQKIRKKLIVWRCIAIAIFIFVLFSVLIASSIHNLSRHTDHLVRLKIEGVIGSDVSKQVKLIDQSLKDKSVKGMILYVNSPGGAVTGGEQLHDAIERFANKKPVVVSMGGVAASAGYMISVPARRIFAFNSTLTGSIGVIMQAPDVSKLLNTLGITVDQLVSGPLKGQPSLVKPLSPEGQAMLQGLINDFYDQFVAMVAKGRHMDINRVKLLGDGRPYSGQQALKLGLVDQIGTEDDAKQWLITANHFDNKITVVDLKSDKDSGMLSRFFGEITQGAVDSIIQHIINKENLNLNGAVAIWHP